MFGAFANDRFRCRGVHTAKTACPSGCVDIIISPFTTLYPSKNRRSAAGVYWPIVLAAPLITCLGFLGVFWRKTTQKTEGISAWHYLLSVALNWRMKGRSRRRNEYSQTGWMVYYLSLLLHAAVECAGGWYIYFFVPKWCWRSNFYRKGED